MERVLLNKVTFLVSHYGCDITIVTTNQGARAPFYPFPEQVRMIDLGINYSSGEEEGALRKILTYFQKRRLHRKRLGELLQREKADIVISLFPSESSFIPDIKDGSKKVLELHFNKFFRQQYNRKGLIGMLDRLRTWMDERLVRKFDKFVVLTNEDKGYWGDLPNIEVIPNAAKPAVGRISDQSKKRVIAVGRLDYQKGFDRLIKAWALVASEPELESWRLDIFGQGEWQQMLEQMVEKYSLQQRVKINPPTKNIAKEYAESSLLAMSSHYEGLPMVMIEAMSYGLPVVTFDYKCGPKDIITHNENGVLVREGDIEGLAAHLKRVMLDEPLRRRLAEEALSITNEYDEQRVMAKWYDLFETLVNS